MLLAALLAVACALTITAPASGLTKAQLHSKLISLSNLPTGWSVDNSSSSSSVSSGCLASLKKPPGKGTKVTVSYANGQLPQLDELLASGPREVAAYNELNHVLARCKHFTASNDGQTETFTVGAMSFPQLGDQSAAYQITFSVQGVNAGFDVLLFRTGSIEGVVVYGDIGSPDSSQFQAFATEAINKVEGKPFAVPTTF